MVDLHAESKLLYLYQGSELPRIYENILRNYTINFTTLFSYAKRRNKEQDVKAFMRKHLHHLVKDIMDD